METKVVEIQDLSKSFDDKVVLKSIHLEIKEGENLVILGKSGSGKSVLIKCLVGLIEVDKGKILLFGENIIVLNNQQLNTVRKKIGFLFQGAALYDSMTVEENLLFQLRDDSSLTRAQKQILIVEALKNVGLENSIDLMPSELSGGMRKRIGLARALILKPKLMCYDEPTTGLDPITSREISQLILDVQKQNNTSSIIITHDIACAKIVANRIIIIKDGEFIADGTFETLSNSDDEWIRSFFI